MTDKQIIIDGVDVSGCELYRDDNGVFAPDGTAERTELCYLTNDYCGNNPNCYYKQLKRKEQECEKLKKENCELTEEVSIDRALFAEIDQLKAELEQEKALKETYLACYKAKHEDIEGKLFKLKAELKSSKELRKYTYDCCKRAGEELAKNSFDWDGKEKNLVVQAIELNERFNQLKAENEELKNLNTRLDNQRETYWKGYQKLKQTLTEIKEIAEVLITTTDEYDSCYYKDRCSKCEVKDNCQYFKVEQILQKISEVENEN